MYWVLGAKTGQWHQFLTPLVASISVLFATTIAIQNLQQSRKHEVLKRTLELLSKKPKVDHNLFEARVKINQIINQLDLHNHYDNYSLMKSAMQMFDKKSAETIMEHIDYYDNLVLGFVWGFMTQISFGKCCQYILPGLEGLLASSSSQSTC
ncbi:hypothetical protein HJ028_13390 [Vibrio parahaemolyticus]|nr:hypothetical protein [Vibrio parahaemolyticus]